jgi:TRAP-type C4-dicarboxylate transport system substrate-binding protein
MTSKRGTLALMLSSALLLSACGGGASGSDDSDKVYKLKYASYNVADAAEAQATKQWAKDIEEATDGRVKIEMFFQEVLLKAPETLRGVADGRADIGFLANGYYPAELPLTGVAGVPFLTDNIEVQGKAFYQMYADNPALEAEYAAQGVHVLTWAPGPPSIVALRDPADGLDDFQGRKIRGYGYISNALADLGANPVSIGQGEVYEAIQRGVLDGTSGGGFDVMADRSFQEVAPHLMDVNIGTFAMTMNVINLELWNEFPQDIKDAFDKVGSDYLEKFLESTTRAEDAACDKMLADDDVKMTVFERSITDEWADRVLPGIKDAWAKDVASSNSDVDPDAFYDEYVSALADNAGDPNYQTALKRCAARQ